MKPMRNAPRGFHAAVCTFLRNKYPGLAVTPQFGKFRFFALKYGAEVIIQLPDEMLPTSITDEDTRLCADWLIDRVGPALAALSE